MTRRAEPVRYRLAAHPAVPDDLEALVAYGPEVVAAARTALDDLAHGRVTGKALGDRHVSGDLTGLASVKFDIPDSPTRRFRLVYGDVGAETHGSWPSASATITRSIGWRLSGYGRTKSQGRPERIHKRIPIWDHGRRGRLAQVGERAS